VLFCAQANHDSQVIFGGNVEQISRRNGVLNTNCVNPVARHHGEVAAKLPDIMEFLAGVIPPKRTIRYALNEEFLRTNKDEFPANRWPEIRGTQRQWCLWCFHDRYGRHS